MGGLTMLLVSGIISPAEALSGLSNEGMVTVAVLYVVVAGVRESGGTDLIIQQLLGRPRSLADGQLRLMAPVAALSAFLNNTPVVAIMIPAVLDWSQTIQPACIAAAHPVELCVDSRRHVYADRYEHQLGGEWAGQISYLTVSSRLF